MMFTHKNLMTVCCAAVLALGLAACGSSSDDEMAATTPTTPMMDGDGDAMNGDGDADAMNGDGDAKTPAETLAAAKVVYDALTDESTDEDRAAAVAELEEALKLAGNEDAYVAYLEKQIVDQAQTVADAAAKAAKDERIAREMVIRTAIMLPANRVGTTAKPVPTADDGSGVTAVTATRNAAGMVTVDVNGAADDVYGGGETAAGDGDWNSVTLTKTDAGTEATDTVVIYTDIAAPKDKLFTAQYLRPTRDDILNDADRVKKAQSDSFPTGADTQFTYGAMDGRPKSFTGSFDGVSGSFECTAEETCTLTTNAKGEVQMVEGWRFSPNAPNTATIKDPDVAYAYFGWWLNKPKDNTAAHDVEVFAGGTANHAVTVTNAIEGTATYAGPAAGKYVTKTVQAGVHSDSGVGHFTADANLTAKFDVGDDAGTIGGSVTNFMLDDTTAASWKVTLEDITLTDGETNFNGTTEVDFGGGATAGGAGTWQGSFYDADADDATNAPGTVAGTFDALTDDASVIGGFGATKQ